ncbi:PaaI family thioesterase [Pseudogemmobacter sonorensis]|uniref:PaaI family thioesterase n=1 Tax=Pseudogemmobacter sonorensis TaxID=2989681 RepID=UPI0036BE7EBE
MEVVMGAEALSAFLREEFGQVAGDFALEAVEAERVWLRMRPAERHLRPGGTVSGPSLFALADVAMYLAILSRIGPVALAVTTNCSIDFMRKPAPGRDLLAEARILKLGRVLVVGDVLIRSLDEAAADGDAAGHREGPVVARASLTYSIPPR